MTSQSWFNIGKLIFYVHEYDIFSVGMSMGQFVYGFKCVHWGGKFGRKTISDQYMVLLQLSYMNAIISYSFWHTCQISHGEVHSWCRDIWSSAYIYLYISISLLGFLNTIYSNKLMLPIKILKAALQISHKHYADKKCFTIITLTIWNY